MNKRIALITLNPQLACSQRFLELKDIDYLDLFHSKQDKFFPYVIERIGSTTPDTLIQKCLELQRQGCVFLNQLNNVRLIQDKWWQFLFFKEQQILTPLSFLSFPFFYPILAKKRRSMKGEGIFLINNLSDFVQFKMTNEFKNQYFWQTPLRDSFGTDYRVLYLGGQILGTMRRHHPNNFMSNISKGGTGEISKATSAEIEITLFIAKKLQLNFFALDFLRVNSQSYLLEINTSPGFIEFEKVFEINVVERLYEFISKRSSLQ